MSKQSIVKMWRTTIAATVIVSIFAGVSWMFLYSLYTDLPPAPGPPPTVPLAKVVETLRKDADVVYVERPADPDFFFKFDLNQAYQWTLTAARDLGSDVLADIVLLRGVRPDGTINLEAIEGTNETERQERRATFKFFSPGQIEKVANNEITAGERPLTGLQVDFISGTIKVTAYRMGRPQRLGPLPHFRCPLAKVIEMRQQEFEKSRFHQADHQTYGFLSNHYPNSGWTWFVNGVTVNIETCERIKFVH